MGMRPLFIWGTGQKANELNQFYHDELFQIEGYIDNDPCKWGEDFLGKKIYSPEQLKKENHIDVFVCMVDKTAVVNQIRKNFGDCDVNIVNERYLIKKKLFTRYKDCKDSEIVKVLEWLRNNELQNFNYEFTSKYLIDSIEMRKDYSNGLFYVLYEGKKVYFSSDYRTEEEAKKYYLSLLIEQDQESPHRYERGGYEVDEGDVVIDGGAAEGIFAVNIIERARRIYLFEPDEKWCEALYHTFYDYRDKVVIVNKAISDYDSATTTRIDEVVQEEVNYIKLDVEGEEYYALRGALTHLKAGRKIKCAVCTYHQEFAYFAIKDLLESFGFEIIHSEGYMWFAEHFNLVRPPVLRRGLIFARKIPRRE